MTSPRIRKRSRSEPRKATGSRKDQGRTRRDHERIREGLGRAQERSRGRPGKDQERARKRPAKDQEMPRRDEERNRKGTLGETERGQEIARIGLGKDQ